MSDTPAQSHLTVEDAGSTTDPADLANHGVGHAVPRDEDPVESADEVARSADGVSEFAVDEDGTAEPVREARDQDRVEPAAPVDQQQPDIEPVAQSADTEPVAESDTAREAGATPRRPDLSALADADIGHVFDQTNGVIERADGDSDGSGESDVLSESLRSEDDPTVVDAGVHGDGEVPETRRTGD